ncbi:endonuclease/exonuclease/phosphatase family protein [Belliella baltica DSM 15883]|uniref:Endonuclease/exonuclease/phosphatase family protein n=1 Tax=Belliella baltica (strain DSM 15883 / CIP 108006 / LMG 21964 / BA134) TaxID=866536 RepID=I3Z8V7_BELBD|nr:choice-of-anchor J domain-containing protein [Belliella baltica]AFL85675.1 endonuclease/exonuclease/phosphatase family protein [Belliella baltica DSM 15883]
MKHYLRKTLMFAMLMCWSMISLQAQTEVIAGWTFESSIVEDRIIADLGNSLNTGDNAQIISPVNINFTTYVQGTGGSGTFSKNTNAWQDAATSEKYWQIKVNTLGFDNLNLSSRQQGSSTGPRDFKIDYSLDGLTWVAIPGSEITVGTTFGSATVDGLAIPAEASNKNEVFFRWIATSNNSIGGGTVASTGTNRIDDILLQGIAIEEEPDQELTTLALWDFTGQPGNQAFNSGIGSTNVNAINFTRGSGIAPTNAANSISSSGWSISDENDYFSFGLEVEEGFQVTLNQLILATRASNTGPGKLALRSSLDNFSSNITVWDNVGTTFSNQNFELTSLDNLTGTIEFRIYANEDVRADGGSPIASGGTLRVANFSEGGGVFSPVRFLGSVSEIPAPEPIEFVNWDFTGTTGSQEFTVGTALVSGVEARDFGRGSGINSSSASNSISSSGWNAGDDRYFTFGFNVAADKLIDLNSVKFGARSSGTGPAEMALVYSGDDFSSNLATWTQPANAFINLDFDLSNLQNLSGAVEFRIITTSDVSASGGTIGSGGTYRITNFFPGPLPVSFTGVVKNASGVIIPGLTTDPTSLEFGSVSKNDDTPVLSYTLSAVNLESGVTVSATAPYSVSKDGNSFSPSIEFTVDEMATEQTVFVQLDNSAEGNFNGTISNTTDGATPVSVAVSASVFDPFNISEDFNSICQTDNGPIGSSWSTVSVSGDQVWACTRFGRAGTNPTASTPFGVQINGFAGGAVLNEDWLISAPYDLTGFNIPLMTFWSRVAFGGPRLQLLISTDYVDGNPNDATWTELSDRFATSDVWTFSGQVDLSAYLNETVRIAFVYNSSPKTGAARWTLDDFALFSSDVPAEPFFSNNIGNVDYFHFGVVPVGETSTETRTFNFGLSNAVADLTITGGEGFEFSKDGETFSPTLIYSMSELTGQKTVTIRFAPTSEGAFAGPITFESGAINISRGYLTGATINKEETFDVVNWNIEWFGSTNSGQGPANVDLQLENVKRVIEDLDADVYAFQEITSLAKFTELADALPGYGMAVSPATSAGGEFAEEAQKLTYLFKLATVDTIQTKVLLTGVNPSDLVGYPSTPDRFWASGRLPYLMDIKTNINGVQENVTLVNVHTRSNGGGESSANPRYSMRKYDVNVLKDSLDAYYNDVNLILLGDFNDDLDETVADQTAATVNTTETSFINYINDTENYNPITISLSNAGLRTFPTFENVIDHQIISTELIENWVVNSERIVAPYGLIPNYDNSTSDHLPVESRFIFRCDLESAQVVASETQVCAGSNSVDFELLGGRFDSIIGWEISIDEGTSWSLIEGSAELSKITVENLESSAFVRAIIDSNICDPIPTEAAAVSIKTLPTPFIAFESGKLFTLEGDYSYQWFKNGVLIAISSINETRIQGAGIYTVLITDADGCTSLSEEYAFPTVNASNKVKVYPNPSSRVVNVELKRTEGLQNVELRAANGVLIESNLSTGELVQFDVSSLAKGVYLIMITDRNGNTTVERLIVR